MRAAFKAALASGAAFLGLSASPAMAADCGKIASLALPNGKVTSAELVPAGQFKPPAPAFGPPPGVDASSPYAKLPAFCRVQATLTPTSDSDIKVEVWLPAAKWNGKYVGIGNGIWAGQLSISQLVDPLARGYAVATTDTGHTGTGLTAEFAIGHPEKLVDFGHRAVHEMTVTAKRVIAAFYGKGPSLSFWNSCSTGGRQGLMEAYRYPEDYDAISAMAPANPMTSLMAQTMWAGIQPYRTQGAALSVPKLSLVHKAAVAQCDKLDGLEDGLIGRPNACGFDPGTLQCRAGDGEDCLSAEQVGTVRALYGGVRDPKTGAQLLPGWPVGAEMQLAAIISAPQPFPVALTYYSMLVFGDRPGWDYKTFDFARDTELGRQFGASILDVPHDGLGPFFARGGKLLLSHGWNDGLIPASNSLRFYGDLYRALPAPAAQQQLRLFMVPGMDHCAGGEGTSEFDTLGTIDAWASTGVAPSRIIAARGDSAPNAPHLPPISRPLCPWPLYAKYDGKGDPANAASFACVPPD